MVASTITFRKAAEEEMPEVVELAKALAKELPITHRDYNFLESHLYQVHNAGVLDTYIAIKEGEIVGTLAFILGAEPWSGRVIAYEAFWYVKPEYRGGVGMGLLKYVEKNLKCDTIDLGIYDPRLLKLLQRFGYTAIKTIVTKEL